MKRYNLASITFAVAILTLATYLVDRDLQHEQAKATYTHAEAKQLETKLREERTALYLRLNGSPAPKAVAKAAINTKRPELSAGQALVESNANPRARGKAGEVSAWQIREADWGKVPRQVKGQAAKNEKIMDELLQSSRDLHTAIRMYNGRKDNPKTAVYLAKVRRKTLEMAVLV